MRFGKPSICKLGILSSVFLAACGGSDGPRPPDAENFSIKVEEDGQTVASLRGTAKSNGELTYSISAQPTNGSVTLTGATFTYTPKPDYAGTDTFTYTVSENELTSAKANVSITVSPVNDAPTADHSSVTVNEDETLNATLSIADIDSETLSISIVNNVENGELSINEDNSFTYQPSENFNGTDRFEFTVSDGELTSQSAFVYIEITAVNDAPVVESKAINVIAGSTLNVDITGSDIDDELETLSYEVISPFSQATLVNDPSTSGQMEVAVPYGSYGRDVLSYVANDGELNSEAAEVALNISVPATKASVSDYKYNANGQVDVIAVTQAAGDKTWVVGNVRGDFDAAEDEIARSLKSFIAIHTNDGSLEKILYFGQGQSGVTNAAFLQEEGRVYVAALMLDNKFTFVEVDSSDEITKTKAFELPYGINRENKQYTLTAIPGSGFYLLGNDKQLSWIDLTGSLRSTKAMVNPLAYEIQRWVVQDTRVIDDKVYIAGSLYACDSNNGSIEECFGGIGRAGFLLQADTTGTPLSMLELSDQFISDAVILSDSSVALTWKNNLALINNSGELSWTRTLEGTSDSSQSKLAALNDDNLIWWCADRGMRTAVVSRLNKNNELAWETALETEAKGSMWLNELHADEFGNSYFNFIDRYNSEDNMQAFGALHVVHVDYSGAKQWESVHQPSDLNPNSDISSKSVLTSDKRLIVLAQDNINAGGGETDGFLITTKIENVTVD